MRDLVLGLLLITTSFVTVPGSAAGQALGDTSIFSPLPLPPGNTVRSANGAPGPNYWQQQVDYHLDAVLDTAAGRFSGRAVIHYTNNSPDTLRFVWLQAGDSRPTDITSLYAPSTTTTNSGFEVGPAMIDGRNVVPKIYGAMVRIDLPRPLSPRGGRLVLTIPFAAPIQMKDFYLAATWYPRLAVYDDVNGWNTDPYRGPGEFYLEYGNIEYAITAPAGYIVAGTGVLQNADEVLTPTQRARLAQARKSDTTVHVITAEESALGAARPVRAGTLTWRFRAERVRGVAWLASPKYLWDATSWDGILVQSYYRADSWKNSAQIARSSLREYSTRWFRYPYPQLSAVQSWQLGMEYPMVAVAASSSITGSATAFVRCVIDHEVAHMWYPMMVGSDERRYAWMDEGVTTFVTIFSGNTRPKDPCGHVDPAAPPTLTSADKPVVAEYYQGGLVSAYRRPAFILYFLRNKVLGPDVFDAALREYTRRWMFKHPQPADFFRTIEDMAGRDLDWFWRSWFYTTAALDQAVESVKPTDRKGETEIVLRNIGTAVMPVELELTLADSTKQLVRLPVEIWYGTSSFKYRIEPAKPIVAVRLNSDGGFPDINPKNDTWSLKDRPPEP